MPSKIDDDFVFVGTARELDLALGDRRNRRIGDNALILLVDDDPTPEHRERMAAKAAAIKHGNPAPNRAAAG